MTIDEAFKNGVRQVVREEIRAALQEHAGGKAVDALLTYKQAAELVRYHVSTITKWVRDGLLPAHGRGKGKRVYRADVLKALELASKPKAAPTAQEIANKILSPKLRSVR